jgi:hypothetical protein
VPRRGIQPASPRRPPCLGRALCATNHRVPAHRTPSDHRQVYPPTILPIVPTGWRVWAGRATHPPIPIRRAPTASLGASRWAPCLPASAVAVIWHEQTGSLRPSSTALQPRVLSTANVVHSRAWSRAGAACRRAALTGGHCLLANPDASCFPTPPRSGQRVAWRWLAEKAEDALVEPEGAAIWGQQLPGDDWYSAVTGRRCRRLPRRSRSGLRPRTQPLLAVSVRTHRFLGVAGSGTPAILTLNILERAGCPWSASRAQQVPGVKRPGLNRRSLSGADHGDGVRREPLQSASSG